MPFTPILLLPGNATIVVQVGNNGVLDLSGNGSNSFYSTFTTTVSTDTIPPAVVMVTPQNGATGIALNTAVVLTFSKSLNRSTINYNTFGLLVNGGQAGFPAGISADNRVVTLTGGTLPPATTVAVVVTNGVQDLSGNA